MSEQFGNGTEWSSFVGEPPLAEAAVRAMASWFLVLHPRALAPGRPTEGVDDPTDTVDVPGSQEGLGARTTTNVTRGASAAEASLLGPRFVFPVHRGPQSRFDFVSVGRNAGNDLFIPNDSISRFHAFFRETPTGLVVVDAKSQNGTKVRGVRVPPQGEGEPSRVSSGDQVRFGDLGGLVLDAAALFALTRAR